VRSPQLLAGPRIEAHHFERVLVVHARAVGMAERLAPNAMLRRNGPFHGFALNVGGQEKLGRPTPPARNALGPPPPSSTTRCDPRSMKFGRFFNSEMAVRRGSAANPANRHPR